MVMLELGNLSSTLAPFNVGIIADGFAASSQDSGLVVSLELFFAAIGALFFGASNLKGQKLAFLGCFIGKFLASIYNLFLMDHIFQTSCPFMTM